MIDLNYIPHWESNWQYVSSKFPDVTMSEIQKAVDDIIKIEKDKEEESIAKAIEENDFICGSKNIKAQLEQNFPNMNVLFSPYANPEEVIMIKKFTLNSFGLFEGEE